MSLYISRIKSVYRMNDISIKNEDNTANLLERSVQLFQRSGLDDLAIKSEKILRNYNTAISLR
jgi:hypothetical protein